ncbi:unnamed protein product, partial [Brenthis ino]
MGKKRKRDKSEESIRKKIRKLENKLQNRRRIISSDEDIQSPCEDQFLQADKMTGVLTPCDAPCSPHTVETHNCEHQDGSQLFPADPATEPIKTVDDKLDEGILEILGNAPEPDTTLGKPIHKDIAARWIEVLKKGLNKEQKDLLAKEYLVPSNCELLVPPVLNPEVKVALLEQFIKRDTSLMNRQKRFANALSALGQSIEIIISTNCEQGLKQKVLKPVSDVCKILCDMHHDETKTRRKFVIASINTSLKDTLVNSEADKFLFGDNMSEKLKTAKTVQRSAEALKVTQAPFSRANFSNNKSFNSKNNLNYKPLHQKTTGRQHAGRPYAVLPPRHQNSSSQRQTHWMQRPPPPPPPSSHQPPPPIRRSARK